jgi:hypothetical protein
MAHERCERCKLTKSDVFLHQSGDCYCKLCATYNDSCLKQKIMPDWKSFLSLSTSVAEADLRITNSSACDQAASVSKTGQNQRLLSNLNDLKTISKEDFTETFIVNLQVWFRYSLDDVQESLQALSMDLLSPLHKALGEKAVTMFPQFKDFRTRNRQVIRTVTPDIVTLGYSIVNEQPMKDLEKLSVSCGSGSTEQAPTNNNDEISNLLEIVTSISQKMLQMETDISRLKNENSQLRLSFSLLQLSVSKGAPVPQIVPEVASTSAVSNIVTPVSSESGTALDVSNPDLSSHDPSTETADLNQVSVNGDDTISDTSSIYSDCGEKGFEFQRSYKKKLSQLEKRLSKMCTTLEAKMKPSLAQSTADKKSRSAEDTVPMSEASSTKSTIYLGGVDPRHSERDVEQYVESLVGMGNDIQVMRLAAKPESSSYKVTLASSFASTVLDPRNWSNTIRVRPFHSRKQSTTQHQHSFRSHYRQQPFRNYHNQPTDGASWGDAQGHFTNFSRHSGYGQRTTRW